MTKKKELIGITDIRFWFPFLILIIGGLGFLLSPLWVRLCLIAWSLKEVWFEIKEDLEN